MQPDNNITMYTLVFAIAFLITYAIFTYLWKLLIRSVFVREENHQAEKLREFNSAISKTLDLQEILDLENAIDAKERELQNLHVKCLTTGECSAQVGMMFSDLASNLERGADHATNIAFSILEEDPEGDKPPKVELA